MNDKDFPAGAIFNGRCFADRVEMYYTEYYGIDLTQNSDWLEFRRCFEHLAQYTINNNEEIQYEN